MPPPVRRADYIYLGNLSLLLGNLLFNFGSGAILDATKNATDFAPSSNDTSLVENQRLAENDTNELPSLDKRAWPPASYPPGDRFLPALTSSLASVPSSDETDTDEEDDFAYGGGGISTRSFSSSTTSSTRRAAASVTPPSTTRRSTTTTAAVRTTPRITTSTTRRSTSTAVTSAEPDDNSGYSGNGVSSRATLSRITTRRPPGFGARTTMTYGSSDYEDYEDTPATPRALPIRSTQSTTEYEQEDWPEEVVDYALDENLLTTHSTTNRLRRSSTIRTTNLSEDEYDDSGYAGNPTSTPAMPVKTARRTQPTTITATTQKRHRTPPRVYGEDVDEDNEVFLPVTQTTNPSTKRRVKPGKGKVIGSSSGGASLQFGNSGGNSNSRKATMSSDGGASLEFGNSGHSGVQSQHRRIAMMNGDMASMEIGQLENGRTPGNTVKFVTSMFNVQTTTPSTVFHYSDETSGYGSQQSFRGETKAFGSATSQSASSGSSFSNAGILSDSSGRSTSLQSGSSSFGDLSKAKKSKVIAEVVSGIVQTIRAGRNSSTISSPDGKLVININTNISQGNSSLSLPGFPGPIPQAPSSQSLPNLNNDYNNNNNDNDYAANQIPNSGPSSYGDPFQDSQSGGGDYGGNFYSGRAGRSLGDGYGGNGGGSGWGSSMSIDLPPAPYPPPVPAPFIVDVPPPPYPPSIPNIVPPPMPNFNVNLPPFPPFPDMPGIPSMPSIQFPPFPSMSGGWGGGGGTGWGNK